jgi:hypothetical protein
LRIGSDPVDGSPAYVIRSAGSDGISDRGVSDYTRGEIERFEQDIIFSNGNFMRYAEGI